MTIPDCASVERALIGAFAEVPAPSGLASLDARVSAAIAMAPSRASSSPRWGGRALRLAVVALGIIAAVTVAAGGARLLERLSSNYAGWERAWDRAQPVNLSRTVNGHTVTVVGAYLDANALVLGLSGHGMHIEERLLLVDGVRPDGGGAVGATRQGESAQLSVSYLPRGVGRSARVALEVLQLRSPGSVLVKDPVIVRGPWRFAFDVRSAGGAIWTGRLVERASSVKVTLERLVVSPTTVRGRLRFAVDGHDPSDRWISPIGTIHRAGKVVGFMAGSFDNGSYTFATEQGFDEAAGRFSLRIDELVLDHGSVRINGPWTFDVEMPS